MLALRHECLNMAMAAQYLNEIIYSYFEEGESSRNIVNDDFSVRWRLFQKEHTGIEDEQMGCILRCDFTPHRPFTDKSWKKDIYLSENARDMLDAENAGGSSQASEVLSYEILFRSFGAELGQTEMKIEYTKNGKMIDYTCGVFDSQLGVSVTRADTYGSPFTPKRAKKLLNKKLNGIIEAFKNLKQKGLVQVVHIWSADEYITNTLVEAFQHLEPEVVSNTVVVITTTIRTPTTPYCDFIFRNGTIVKNFDKPTSLLSLLN